MELAYKKVYKMENGALVRNTKNKIEYRDKTGIKRTKTNPTYADFAELGMYPKKQVGDIPTYDPVAEELKEHIVLEDNIWQVSYEAVKKEVI